MAQIFLGCQTTVADVYPLRKQSDIPARLEDNIREWGAMDKLISDCAKAAMSVRVKRFCVHSAFQDGTVNLTIKIKTSLRIAMQPLSQRPIGL